MPSWAAGVGGGGRGGAGAGPSDVQWMPDGKTLLVQMVKPNRGSRSPRTARAHRAARPGEPGRRLPVVTHEDMLQNPHDEDLFEYYATSQLALVDVATAKMTPIGKAGIIESARISPDGKNLLVTTIHRPFSYLHDASAFPKEIEIWDRTGKVVHKVASQPLEDRVPINGVMTGPRSIQWRPNDAATLMWVEALDKGDLKNKVPNRDRLVALKAPFTGEPREVVKTEQRFGGMQFFEKGGRAFVSRHRTPDAARAHLPDRNRRPGHEAQTGLEPQQPGPLQGSRLADAEAPAHRRQRHPAGWRQHLPHRHRRQPQGRPSRSWIASTSSPARPSASSSATTTITKWWTRCSTTTARRS